MAVPDGCWVTKLVVFNTRQSIANGVATWLTPRRWPRFGRSPRHQAGAARRVVERDAERFLAGPGAPAMVSPARGLCRPSPCGYFNSNHLEVSVAGVKRYWLT